MTKYRPGIKVGTAIFRVYWRIFGRARLRNGKSAKSQASVLISTASAFSLTQLHLSHVGTQHDIATLPIRRGSRFSPLPKFRFSHVALDLQRDIAYSWHDVVHAFLLFASNYFVLVLMSHVVLDSPTLPTRRVYLIWQYPSPQFPPYKNQPPITGGW